MFLLLLAMTADRCVAGAPCPTDGQILAAVRTDDVARVLAAQDAAAREQPDEIILYHSERIRRIADVLCGDRLPGDRPAITCRFTVRYWTRDAHTTARLVEAPDGWRIDAALAVTRRRR